MQQRMNSNMGSRVKIRFELVPKLRWLIPKIPFKVFISRREVTFFRPRSLLVPSNSHDHRLIATFLNHRLERIETLLGAKLDEASWIAKLHVAVSLRQQTLSDPGQEG